MPDAPNVDVEETQTITIDTYVSNDISNSISFVTKDESPFYNIKFTGFTIDGNDIASGKLDISGQLQLNGGGVEGMPEMSVYVYESVITTADLSTNTPNFTTKEPVYIMDNNLTPYFDGSVNSDGSLIFVDISGNFNFPIDTPLYLYLVSTLSDGGPTLINENYTSFTLKKSTDSSTTDSPTTDSPITDRPTLTSITPFGGLVTGGADFTLTGTNFKTVTHVKFGTVTADNFTITNSTTIIGKTPAQADHDDGLHLIYINSIHRSNQDFSTFISIVSSNDDVSFNYYLEASFNELVTAALEKINFPITLTNGSNGNENVNIYDDTNTGTPYIINYNTLDLSGNSNIADYFSLLSNYDNSNNDYLAARQTMVNALFDKAATEYPGADPSLNSIIIDSGDFPFSKTEKTQKMNSNVANKYKLVDYRQQNYTIINFTYENINDTISILRFLDYMNNSNLSTYVPIPTTDKSEFTFVFNNTILKKFVEEVICAIKELCPAVSASTGNIYAKIDVSNADGNTPLYRVRAFSSNTPVTDVNTLDDNKADTSGKFYIIRDPGINGNWASIDEKKKYTEDASYNKYDIIQYNGVNVNGNATGKVEQIELQASTSTGDNEYREPQTKISMNLDIEFDDFKQAFQINFNFIMGSLIFGSIDGSITNNTNTIFNPTELGGGFSGISPKPIVLVERGNQRGMSRMTLRRAGYQDVNSFIANNPGYNTNYIIQGGQAVKNKAFLKQDSSDRTRRLKLKAENLTYNDLTFGGDKNNGSYTARSRARY